MTKSTCYYHSLRYIQFLDNAIARTESDLKSCKVDSQNTMHTLTTGKDEIEELEWIKLEGGRVLARLTGLTKSLQLTIPNIDRHRMAMIRKRQEYRLAGDLGNYIFAAENEKKFGKDLTSYTLYIHYIDLSEILPIDIDGGVIVAHHHVANHELIVPPPPPPPQQECFP